jgi:hypothetical protein
MRKSLPAAVLIALFVRPAFAADPPDDARQVLVELEKEIQAIEAKARAEIKDRRVRAVEQLKQLQDKYTKAGALDEAVAVRDLVRALSGPAVVVRADPGSLRRFRGQPSPLFFEVTGSTTGSVWGTDEYTDDSALSTAAVHAGVLKPGEKGIVQVTLVPGGTGYRGTIRNGVTTTSHYEFGGGYKVAAAPGVRPGAERGIDPLPESMKELRGRNGAEYLFEVTGMAGGKVWGTDVYTDDSDLAAAAVHAGVLKDGQKGVVKVTVLAGQPTYTGSTRNGVTSSDYGTHPGSFKVEAGKSK